MNGVSSSPVELCSIRGDDERVALVLDVGFMGSGRFGCEGPFVSVLKPVLHMLSTLDVLTGNTAGI